MIELLNVYSIHKYQSLIGSLQWAVSLRRIDITTAVISISSFRSAPRIGYLERAKIIIGYLSRMKEEKLLFRVSLLHYSDISYVQYDWEKSIYGDTKEALSHDAPISLGNHVIMTHYVDAYLFHYIYKGISVTRLLYFLNKIPIDWFFK